MKILYLAHRIPYPPNKGDKIRAYHQVRYLSERHALDLVCLLDDDCDRVHAEPLKQLCHRVHAEPIRPLPSKVKGLFVQLLGGTVSVGYFHRAAAQKVVNRWLRDTAYDAIVCFSSTMAEYAFRSGCLDNRPRPRLIMDFCDVDSDKWRQYAESARFPLNIIYRCEHRRLRRYEQRIHNVFDSSILISRQEADLFVAQTGADGHIAVIPNGIDSAYFRMSDDSRNGMNGQRRETAPRLIFTGAMDYHANIDGVLWFVRDVLPQIRLKHPSVHFMIVGSNPHADIQKLREQPGIEVTGFVDDIRPYYAKADISVAPLRLARGVQNKVLEAMAMERAVVTTSAANNGIRAISGEHLLVADSPGGFAVAVNELLDNAGVRRRLGKSARKFVVSEFDWERNLEQFDLLLTTGNLSRNESNPAPGKSWTLKTSH